MTKVNKGILFVFLGLLLFLSLWGIWKTYIFQERNYYHHIMLDKDNYLLVTSYTPKKGEDHLYLERMNIQNGRQWRFELENYDTTPIYESIFDRHCRLYQGKLSFYNSNSGMLSLFNDETGELISSLDIGIDYEPAYWTALSDDGYVYVQSWKEETKLLCLSLQDLSLQWATELPCKGSDLSSPMQSEDWISTYLEDYSLSYYPLLFISKKEGTLLSANYDIPGFLKDHFYYGGRWESGTLALYRMDLNTEEEIYLYSLPGEPGEDREYPDLCLFDSKLIYFARNGSSQSVQARDLDQGDLIWALDLPEGFINRKDMWEFQLSRSAPDQAALPLIEHPFLPLLLEDNGPESPVNDIKTHKWVMLDLEQGRIARESITFYWPANWSGGHSILSGIIKSGSTYHMQLPYPDSDYRKSILIGFNGLTGETEYCIGIQKDSTYGLNMYSQWIPRNLQGMRFILVNYEKLYLWDLKNLKALNKSAERFQLVDMTGEMEERYGF